jgi:NAD(P)-dependent dehydrogenase (short-subunit alcohol dehydrogenase family)
VQPIDLLINNAGIMGPDQPRQSRDGIDAEGWAETMRVNALGPVLVTLALKENLARSANPRAVTISTALGSIADNTSGGLYAYRMSKAAVNMGNRGLAADLRDRRICCVVLHPGWVQTDMGGGQAPLAPADSVSGIRRVVAGLTLEHSGRFFAHDGAELAW